MLGLRIEEVNIFQEIFFTNKYLMIFKLCMYLRVINYMILYINIYINTPKQSLKISFILKVNNNIINNEIIYMHLNVI